MQYWVREHGGEAATVAAREEAMRLIAEAGDSNDLAVPLRNTVDLLEGRFTPEQSREMEPGVPWELGLTADYDVRLMRGELPWQIEAAERAEREEANRRRQAEASEEERNRRDIQRPQRADAPHLLFPNLGRLSEQGRPRQPNQREHRHLEQAKMQMAEMLQRVGVVPMGLRSDSESSLEWEAVMREPGAAGRCGPALQ